MNTVNQTSITEEGVIIHGDAFYNPIQRFNRTMTIRIINTYKRISNKNTLTLLECMSATGIRGIRYCKELKEENTIVMNDMSIRSCNEIVKNCKMNGIEAEVDKVIDNKTFKVEVCNEDCRLLMLKRKSKYDVIDIDPYGTCAPFIETAIEALVDGGLLCVTSTDARVLCDKPPESCFKYYGSISYNCSYSHEIAIRVILSYISRVAAKTGRRIVPVISLSMDFFIRVFVTVHQRRTEASLSSISSSYFYLCSCLQVIRQPILQKNKKEYKHVKVPENNVCSICGRILSLYGPFWSDPLHDKTFLKQVLSEIPETDLTVKTKGDRSTAFTGPQITRRIHGMLNMALEELETIFYYSIPALALVLSLPLPPLDSIVSFLEHNHYSVSLTHCKPNSIKTNAPLELVYLSLLEYYRSKHGEDKYLEYIFKYTTNKDSNPEEPPKSKGKIPVYQPISVILKSILIHKDTTKINILFTLTDTAKILTSKRYLKFQDKEGLNWGPAKKGSFQRQPAQKESEQEKEEREKK
ncbi:tRNA (guanine26-N2/guanine27-N2)-dimethyltransferase [Nematocida sp. AWRm80]|nr:tRNA (guanine26-N2/guanine27-N2)-dimethyltransferase [Nematocida sp. AWRm80]